MIMPLKTLSLYYWLRERERERERGKWGTDWYFRAGIRRDPRVPPPPP
jgi:hypothetical protein